MFLLLLGTAGAAVYAAYGREAHVVDSFLREIFSAQDLQHRNDPSSAFFWTASVIHFVLMLFVTAFMMKAYVAIMANDHPYWKLVLFQLKLLLIGSIAGTVIGVGVGYGLRTAQVSGSGMQFGILIAFLATYTLVYYWLAQQELGAGFLQAVGLGLVIGASSFLVVKGLDALGLGVEAFQRSPVNMVLSRI